LPTFVQLSDLIAYERTVIPKLRASPGDQLFDGNQRDIRARLVGRRTRRHGWLSSAGVHADR
jgi:hypothetical protein